MNKNFSKEKQPINRRSFEPWEEAFIYLTFPEFSSSEIGKHLNRTMGSVRIKLYRNKYNRNIVIEEIKKGDTFGRLTIQYLSDIKKHGSKCFYCKCNCGKFITVRRDQLISGITRSCGCLKTLHGKDYNNIPGKWYRRIQSAAKRRCIVFDISIEYIDSIYVKQNGKCALTNQNISLTDKDKKMASLDRIDNTKGYVEGNVQFLEHYVNIMKSNHTQDDFIEICKMVVNNNESS